MAASAAAAAAASIQSAAASRCSSYSCRFPGERPVAPYRLCMDGGGCVCALGVQCTANAESRGGGVREATDAALSRPERRPGKRKGHQGRLPPLPPIRSARAALPFQRGRTAGRTRPLAGPLSLFASSPLLPFAVVRSSDEARPPVSNGTRALPPANAGWRMGWMGQCLLVNTVVIKNRAKSIASTHWLVVVGFARRRSRRVRPSRIGASSSWDRHHHTAARMHATHHHQARKQAVHPSIDRFPTSPVDRAMHRGGHDLFKAPRNQPRDEL